MSVNQPTPVSAIEGIGEERARLFARMGIHSVYDLLRCTPDQVHAASGGRITLKEARAWRAMGSLQQVRGMTPQWAEALVRGKVTGLEALQNKTSKETLAILRRAKARRWIRSLPTQDTVAEILKDAAILHHTGSLLGTVRDKAGRPVRGALVSIGPFRQTTDARGRFHANRLALGRVLPLTITHKRYRSTFVERAVVAADDDSVGVRMFTLELLPRNVRTPKPRVRLSEFDGDTLPTPSGQPFREEPILTNRFRSGDIFLVRELSKRTGEAKLVSRFKSYEDGTFLVTTARIPQSRLPSGIRLRQHVRYARGEFRRVSVDHGTIRRIRILRGLRESFREGPIPRTAAGRRGAISARMKELVARGFFSGRLAGGRNETNGGSEKG